ncbi:gliding motility lipoprotein GldD [Zeaxanthinibacter enoshimensis]|uniref:gliding motility lipoprotein GldD n=1 Tax=Zeaxanthinibacter enoshimensis TaxID=392009 RepID=UPI003566D6C0
MPLLRNASLIFITLLFLTGCGEEPLPKPRAMLRLSYPEANMSGWQGDCPYGFEYNSRAELEVGPGCALTLDYPGMKGAIYITYKKVEENLQSLLTDAQKLSYEHVVKADNILEQPFVNKDERVYGMFYEVRGNAASQAQFYVTDSTDHFVTGSLYFYAKPNYDSIYPAAVYLQKDIRKIMETLKWQ